MIILMVDALQETLVQLDEHLNVCSQHIDIDYSHITIAKQSLEHQIMELKSSVAYQIEWLETYGADADFDGDAYDLDMLRAIKDEIGAEDLQQLLGIDPIFNEGGL